MEESLGRLVGGGAEREVEEAPDFFFFLRGLSSSEELESEELELELELDGDLALRRPLSLER